MSPIEGFRTLVLPYREPGRRSLRVMPQRAAAVDSQRKHCGRLVWGTVWRRNDNGAGFKSDTTRARTLSKHGARPGRVWERRCCRYLRISFVELMVPVLHGGLWRRDP